MALLPIIIAPDPRLRVKTVPLARVDEETSVFMENMLETDFWNINGDSLNDYDSYFSDLALLLIEEGYVWETYELINEFEQKEEI